MFHFKQILPVAILALGLASGAHAQEQEKELFAKAFAISMTVPQYQKFLTLVSSPPFRKPANDVIAEDRAKEIGEFGKEMWKLTMNVFPAGSDAPMGLALPATVKHLQKHLRQYYTDTDADAAAAAALIHAFYKEGAGPTGPESDPKESAEESKRNIALEVAMFGAGVKVISGFRRSGGLIKAVGTIENVNPFPVWDVGVRCVAYAQSGTAIKEFKAEVKRRIEPRKKIKFDNLTAWSRNR